MKWLRLLCRAGLGGLFVVSGFQKLILPSENFAAVIEKFEILSSPAAAFLSHTLPWAEFFAGVFLAVGLWTPLSLAALWLMNTVFIVVLGSALARKLPLDQCGCFGKNLSIPLPVMLGLDLLIWAAFLFLFLTRRVPTPSLDSRLEK